MQAQNTPMEKEPALELNILGETIVASRANTALFTFLGDLAAYDHVFIVIEEEPPRYAYLFRNQKIWANLTQYLWENKYPMHLNAPEVPEIDQVNFDFTFYSDIRERATFPQEWMETQE